MPAPAGAAATRTTTAAASAARVRRRRSIGPFNTTTRPELRASSPVEGGVSGSVGQERLHAAPEVLRGPEPAGGLGGHRIGGVDAALEVGAQDVLRGRV